MDSTELDEQIRDTLHGVAASTHAGPEFAERLHAGARPDVPASPPSPNPHRWVRPLLAAAAVLTLATGLVAATRNGGHGGSSAPPGSSSSASTPAPSDAPPAPIAVTSFAGMRLTHPISWRYVPNDLDPGGVGALGFLSSQPTRTQCPPSLAHSAHHCRSPIARLNPGGVLLTVNAALPQKTITANSTIAGLLSHASTQLVRADCPLGATGEYSSTVLLPNQPATMFFTLCAADPDQQTRNSITTMFATATYSPQPTSVTQPSRVSTRTVPSTALASPDDTGTGTAHGCSTQPGSIASLTADPDGLTPSQGCLQLNPGQRLRVVNNTNGFGQTGETVTIRMRGLPAINISRGESVEYPKPISTYLAAGQHLGTCSSEPGSSFVLWVLP